MTTSSGVDAVHRENFRNAKLLIIEDNPDHGVVIMNAARYCMPEIKPMILACEQDVQSYLDQCWMEEWELPKLILLDLYLPNRENGWRLLEQIKSGTTALSKIPVVMLSCSNNPDDIAGAYDRGCASYLVKPNRLEEWVSYFQMLRSYWWETVTLPRATIDTFFGK
jgi:CheY-like chemotaxis protein